MLYKLFRDSLPEYLVRHYWWAYLWRFSVWFFDHQPIINAILFGQYKRLMQQTLALLHEAPQDQILQLTCVYGSLTPSILQHISPKKLFITDVAPIQLRLAIKKSLAHSYEHDQAKSRLLATRMNAESLGYKCSRFSTVVIFFLLHELPVDARARALAEAIRVVKPGGRLIITEYGYYPTQHFLYRFPLSRFLLKKYEPFLDDFWSEDLNKVLNKAANESQKSVRPLSNVSLFSGFYRVLDFEVSVSTETH